MLSSDCIYYFQKHPVAKEAFLWGFFRDFESHQKI